VVEIGLDNLENISGFLEVMEILVEIGTLG
jgi:hypothetical protein